MTQDTTHLHTLVRLTESEVRALRGQPSRVMYDLLLDVLSARVNSNEVVTRLLNGSGLELHALFRIDKLMTNPADPDPILGQFLDRSESPKDRSAPSAEFADDYDPAEQEGIWGEATVHPEKDKVPEKTCTWGVVHHYPRPPAWWTGKKMGQRRDDWTVKGMQEQVKQALEELSDNIPAHVLTKFQETGELDLFVNLRVTPKP